MERVHRRNLALLVTGNSVSAFGNAIYILAVVLILKELTESTFAIGVFQFVALLPAVLLSPIVGSVIDRSSRRRIVVISDLARGVLMVLAGGALAHEPLRSTGLVLTVAFLAGLGQSFFVPAVQAWLPSLVPARSLPRATSLRVASGQVGNLAGNALGGLLYVVLGAPALFVANGVTFVLSGLQERMITGGAEAPERKQNVRIGIRSVLAEAREGLHLGLSDRVIRLLIVSQAGLFAISPVLTLSLPFIVIDELGYSEAAVGYFLAIGLAGAIFAFFVLRRDPPESMLARRLVPLAYLGLGLGFLALAITTAPVVLALVALAAGASAAVVYLYATTWIQMRVPGPLHGRLFALLEAANAAVAPVAYLLAGALLAVAGADARWMLFGVIGIAAVGWAAWTSSKLQRLACGSSREAGDNEPLKDQHTDHDRNER